MPIFSVLRKPHPFIFSKLSIIIPGIICFFIIAVTAPFGFSDLSLNLRILFALLFGFNCSFVVFITVNIVQLIIHPTTFDDTWTIGKEVLLVLFVVFMICLANFFALIVLDLADIPRLQLFKNVVVYTSALCVLPIAITVLVEQYMYQKNKLAQTLELNSELKRISKKNSTTQAIPKLDPIQLIAENGTIELEIPPEKIIFLKSDGNYVDVFYKDLNDGVIKILIRNRLKNFSKQLPSTSFFRCHKSYLVNITFVSYVDGNARNLELILNDIDFRIPVSRSKTDELTKFIHS